ncbi:MULTISPECIES: monooxygenase [Idiomarinaceae]|uniref:Monooxygenase ydhR n=3 Tax=Pseudidiomarina TaxID=2800384 RepID=A0A368UJZ3_9GAMM|nr:MULTISPECIES: monooxygenase [Idiomarinaceae]PWW07870.1 putative monooxygenase ydhR [Pseudidiomarina maritima]RBP86827.1 putative monooxygenase ydhR [Pseudidiomarina tainanensis]RCW28996.1 putative monooxygenase ydhR [Pseudidiomarina tainanensis]
MKILQVDFPYAGPFGAEMAAQMQQLAESITQEPGFLWKIWTENQANGEAGGLYAFTDEASAQAYLEMHSARLKSFGVPSVRGRIFDVNSELSTITKAPL